LIHLALSWQSEVDNSFDFVKAFPVDQQGPSSKAVTILHLVVYRKESQLQLAGKYRRHRRQDGGYTGRAQSIMVRHQNYFYKRIKKTINRLMEQLRI